MKGYLDSRFARHELRSAVSSLDGLVEDVTHVSRGGSSIIFRIRRQGAAPLCLKIADGRKRRSRDPRMVRQSIRKEAETLRQLQVDGVPRLHFVDQDSRFLLREFFEGESLSSWRRAKACKPYDIGLIARLVSALALRVIDCVHHHEKGAYVVRDFKPRNVVFNVRDRQVSLIDLGGIRAEARMIGRGARQERLGSRKWVHWAPEQLLEDAEGLDRRADYFSIGSTLYFVIFGEAPYSNSEADPAKVLDTYLWEHEAAARRMRSVSQRIGLPESWEDAITSLLHPSPGERMAGIRGLRSERSSSVTPFGEGIFAGSENAVLRCLRKRELPVNATLVCLRRARNSSPVMMACKELGIPLVHFPVAPSKEEGFGELFEELVTETLPMIREPIVVFCKAGQNRTGMLIGAYRLLSGDGVAEAISAYFDQAGSGARGREVSWLLDLAAVRGALDYL